MAVFNNALAGAAGSGGAAGYEIERSLRFNSADSAHLDRTPASAGNTGTWTFSFWHKRSVNSGVNYILTNQTSGTNYEAIRIEADGSLRYLYYPGSMLGNITSAQKLRDPSAWYHIVYVKELSAAQTADKIRIYVNGTRITDFTTTTYPSSGGFIGNANTHTIGAFSTSGSLNGYLADVHFIDGQALDPTDFGEFDDNNVWQPIEYSGSYNVGVGAVNGFYLPFSDNSSASALGTDDSGNGNDWTVNNISVASGAGNDSLRDSPTNGDTADDTGLGGEVAGNYCTANPLSPALSASYSNGNLAVSQTNAYTNRGLVTGTLGMTAGVKWYFEVEQTSGNTDIAFGVCRDQAGAKYNYNNSGSFAYGYVGSGTLYLNGSPTGSWGATYTVGDIIGIAYNGVNGELSFYKNGALQGVATTLDTSYAYFPFGSMDGSGTVAYIFNFGQRPFAYTAPSGFKALCTANLDAPVVTKPSEYMDVALYTGTSASQDITGIGFSPDLVWLKQRATGSTSHAIYDVIRGGTLALQSDTTAAEQNLGSGNLVTFNSDGFTLGADTAGFTNYTGRLYVGWAWDAGSSTVSNTDGSITSSVRANPTAGFSIVSYTGNGTAGSTIGHGLNVKPAMIWVKTRDNAYQGVVYHEGVDSSSPQNYYMSLFAGTSGTSARLSGIAVWNNTAPTSSVFSVHSYGVVNASSENYIAYCWAPVEGYSAFGKYSGNGSTSGDGAFVYTGFRPRWVLIKNRDNGSGNWLLFDTERDAYNVMNKPLYPNEVTAEATSTQRLLDATSNGFKVRATGEGNYASTEYIYAAFAENPFKYARAR